MDLITTCLCLISVYSKSTLQNTNVYEYKSCTVTQIIYSTEGTELSIYNV